MASSPPRKRVRAPGTHDNANDRVPRDEANVHDGNVSSQQKCSKPASLSSLSKIIAGEYSLNRLAKLRRVLAQRYSGVNIYADFMNTTSTIFVIQTRHHVREYSVDWIGSLEIITSAMNEKWPSLVPSDEDEKLLCLHYMWRVFQFIAENVIFDRKKSQWISDKEAMPGSSSAAAVNEECHQSHLRENNKEEQVLSQEELDKPENQQEGSSPGQGSGDDADDQDNEKQVNLLRNTFRKYHIWNENIPERLVSALESQMHSSCGRDAINLLLRSACAIAFGPDFERTGGVFVYQVGTSDYPFEGFPVSSMDERTSDSPGNEDGPVLNVTEPLALELGPSSPPCVSRGSRKTNSPAESTRSFGKGYIYSDLIVACESSDSAKFLMVVEIKSSSCLHDEAEVLRQAVGALVGQKQVYGLVISHSRATLIKVYREDEESVIYFNRKRYDLLRPLRASPAFNNEHWFEMFMDIVKVLDSARENIVLG